LKPEFNPKNCALIKINVAQTYNKALLSGELAAQTPERSLALNLPKGSPLRRASFASLNAKFASKLVVCGRPRGLLT
jgi:hypothetical protein